MESVSETAKHKEMDMIQDVIKRMAANSFQVKTWMMGIVTAILAFKNEDIFSGGNGGNHAGLWISLVLLFPVVMFWYLDAFFLRTERLYRQVYQWVIVNRPITDKYLYDLNTFIREDFTTQQTQTVNLSSNIGSIGAIMISKTLRWFYAIPLVIIIALFVYNLNLIK